jgi:Carboxypeptidase regulatory-like domain
LPVDLILEVDQHAPILLQHRTFVAGSINDLGELRLCAGRTITGTVTDRAGAPIEGASVEVSLSIVMWDRSATSDAHGCWKIEGIPETDPLVAALVIKAEGFMPVYDDVDLASVREIRRVLYHESKITLHVTPAEAGVGGRVPLADKKDDLGAWFETDVNGIATVSLAPGRYRVALDADPGKDAGTFEVREGIAQDVAVKR